ncbi:MAG TPA: tetratricopeptide repeat protein [Thermoanaerobaculia bacterium]|nr:tetratricopeptide repeat protein [Thermoanaerobaculia bacterium]
MQELHTQLVGTVNEMLGGQETFRDALGLEEENILALAVFARELVDQGRLDDAQTLLEGLVVLDPQNGYLHTCLGALYMQKGFHDSAIVEFRYALRQDPDDVAANTYLGELYLEAGDLDASVTYLERAVSLDPPGQDPYANRARTLAALVATIAREVQEKGPEALEDLQQRAAMLQQMGEA